ncbi:MAG: hypothetical protein R6V44_07095 [Paracoccaceae bacterium]
MPKPKSNASPDLTQAVQMMSHLPTPTALMAPQAEMAWQTQKNLMSEWGRYAEAWFDRRQEAAESAQRCMERLEKAGNGDGAEVNQAVSELNSWMSDEMQRLSSDARDNMELCMRCFGLLSEGAVSAGSRMAEEAKEKAAAATETVKGGEGGKAGG